MAGSATVWIGLTVVVLVVAALVLWHFRDRLAMRLNDWRDRRAESEAAYFAQFKAACQANDPARALDTLTNWIDRIYDGDGVTTVDQFVQDTTDVELRRHKEQLDQQLFAAPSTAHDAWSGQVFYQRVAAVRKHMHKGRFRLTSQVTTPLPPLNP